MQTGIPMYLDITIKILAILLSTVAIFQLREVRRKRHIDMFWKLYEIYTSDNQKLAKNDTMALRSLVDNKINSGATKQEIVKFYRTEYHRAMNERQKEIDRSVINRIRFLNLTGSLLKKNLVDKEMLFELIGIGFEHDYTTLKLVIETHRQDHHAPRMYSTFETVMNHYKKFTK